MGRLESLNFDFGAVNFDTMKQIFSVKASEPLIPQGFLDIEKARWFCIKTIVSFFDRKFPIEI